MLRVLHQIFKEIKQRHKKTIFVLAFLVLYSVTISYAVPPLTAYNPGETLDPNCAPGDTNCLVQIIPDQSTHAGEFLTTDGSNISWDAILQEATTASNGLTLTGNDVALGGALTSDTDLDLSTNTLTITGDSIRYTSDYSGAYTIRSLVDKEYVDDAITSASIPDGDKGDITLSGGATSWILDSDISKNWTGAHSFLDSSFSFLDNLNNTKIAQFELSSISASTTRIYTLPNANGTIALFSDIPTTVSSFTNDSGYITSSSSNALTNKTGNISQWTNDTGYATLTGAESLTNKKLGSLTTNGFVKTSGGDGTLYVDTSTYLTGAYQTIESSGTPLTQRLTLNATGGLTASDNINKTNISIDQSYGFTWTGSHSFRDASLSILDNSDTSKIALFELSSISPSTTRTYTLPNTNGTVITTGNITDITGLTDSQISDTLTSSIFLGSGSTTNAVDLATSEVSGILSSSNGGAGSINGILKANGSGVVSQAVADTDYQSPITLTTTGSSGASTFGSNTLNVPTYTLTGLGGWSLASGGILTGANTITSSSTNTLAFNTTNTVEGARMNFVTATIGGTANTPLLSFRHNSARAVTDGYVDVFAGINNGNSSVTGGNVALGNNNLTSITPGGTWSGSPWFATFRGDRNVAIGFGNGASLLGSGGNQATGNIMIGQRVMASNTNNSFNIMLGFQTGMNFNIPVSGSNGQSNIAIGDYAMLNLTAGLASNNIAIGSGAATSITNMGTANTLLGSSVATNMTTMGTGNTLLGAGAKVNSGNIVDFNLIAGYWGASNAILGSQNNIIGVEAFGFATGGSFNSAIGRNAGWRNNGSSNNYVGPQSGHSTDFVYITGAGSGTVYSGSNSSFIGYRAGYSTASGAVSNVIVISNNYQPTLTTANMYLGGGDITKVNIPVTLALNTVPSNDDALTQVLVRDGTTGEIKYRTSSSIASNAWSLASGGTLTGANTITGSSSNIIKFVFDNLTTTQTNGAGLWLANTTDGSNSIRLQYSPSLVLEAQAWSGFQNDSKSQRWRHLVIPVGHDGNNTTGSTYQLGYAHEGNSYTSLFSIQSTAATGAIITTTPGAFLINNTLGETNPSLDVRGIGTSTGILARFADSANTTRFSILDNGTAIFTPSVTTGTGATSGIQVVGNSLTTGNLIDVSSSSVTTGALAKLTSTSTAINHTINSNGLFQISSSGVNSTSGKTAIGFSSIVTNTHPSASTNIGGYFSASGAATNNFSGFFQGQVLINGTTNASNGSALLIQNSTPSTLLALRNDGLITAIGGLLTIVQEDGGGNQGFPSAGQDIVFRNASSSAQKRTGFTFSNSNNFTGNGDKVIGKFTGTYVGSFGSNSNFSSLSLTPTLNTAAAISGTIYGIRYNPIVTTISSSFISHTALYLGGGINPSAGATTNIQIDMSPVINQTGTATGNIIGLRYNPTLTAVLGTHYAIATGSGLHGFGTLTPTATVHIKSYGTTTGEAFRIADSASTNRFSILDNGEIYGSLINIFGNTSPYSTRIGYQAGITSGATSTYSISLGYNANQGTHNIGADSIGIGRESKSEGVDSIAIGRVSTNRGSQSVSIGAGAGSTSGTHNSFSVNIGYLANGNGALNIGANSVAVGANSASTGSDSLAFGSSAKAFNDYVISIGTGAGNTSGTVGLFATSIGYGSNNGIVNIGAEGIAIGRNSNSSALHSKAFGTNVIASAVGAIAIGYDSVSFTNSTADSIGFGWGATTPDILFAKSTTSYFNSTSGIVFGSNSITANTKFDIRGIGTTTDKALRIADNANTERFSILDNGQVYFNGSIGIGDTSPDNLLEVLSSGTALTQLTISNTNAGDYDTQLGFELADGTNTFTLGVDDSDGDKFKISTTALGTGDAFVVDTTGKLYAPLISASTGTPDAICYDTATKEITTNTGTATCTVSSMRFKRDINPLQGSVLETISRLAPSSFFYNGTNIEHIGLIAEQVLEIEPRLVFFEDDGVTPRGVRYEDLSVLTLKGIQELSIKINTIGDLSVENTFRNSLINWLADANNGIGALFADEFVGNTITAKEKICVGQTCVTEEQLKQLLNGTSASVTPPLQENPPSMEEPLDEQVIVDESPTELDPIVEEDPIPTDEPIPEQSLI